MLFAAINMENLMGSLDIMWQGMLGIFIVIGIIAGSVTLLTRLTSGKKKEKKKEQEEK